METSLEEAKQRLVGVSQQVEDAAAESAAHAAELSAESAEAAELATQVGLPAECIAGNA